MKYEVLHKKLASLKRSEIECAWRPPSILTKIEQLKLELSELEQSKGRGRPSKEIQSRIAELQEQIKRLEEEYPPIVFRFKKLRLHEDNRVQDVRREKLNKILSLLDNDKSHEFWQRARNEIEGLLHLVSYWEDVIFPEEWDEDDWRQIILGLKNNWLAALQLAVKYLCKENKKPSKREILLTAAKWAMGLDEIQLRHVGDDEVVLTEGELEELVPDPEADPAEEEARIERRRRELFEEHKRKIAEYRLKSAVPKIKKLESMTEEQLLELFVQQIVFLYALEEAQKDALAVHLFLEVYTVDGDKVERFFATAEQAREFLDDPDLEELRSFILEQHNKLNMVREEDILPLAKSSSFRTTLETLSARGEEELTH